MEYGSSLVDAAISVERAVKNRLIQEMELTGKDAADIDITVTEIPKEHYEILKIYL